eukprot:1992122-Pleurochrysis_carterae.AAC.6
MAVQLPLAAWLAISARSAPPRPTRSSAMACLRVRGSVETLLIANAQLVPRHSVACPGGHAGRAVRKGREIAVGRIQACVETLLVVARGESRRRRRGRQHRR